MKFTALRKHILSECPAFEYNCYLCDVDDADVEVADENNESQTIE
jgi:hypothetical protein